MPSLTTVNTVAIFIQLSIKARVRNTIEGVDRRCGTAEYNMLTAKTVNLSLNPSHEMMRHTSYTKANLLANKLNTPRQTILKTHRTN